MTASPTPTDAGAGMPGELFAESAKNPTRARDAQVGLPSEEGLLGALNAGWRDGDEFDSQAAIAAILSLIRPAVEAKEREIAKRDEWVTHWQTKCQATNGLLQETKAKLAQAVEDEREACLRAALGVCEDMRNEGENDMRMARDRIDSAIRARSAARGET